MATLKQLREGLRDRLATISGLRTYDVEPGSPNLPAAIVSKFGGEYGQTMGTGNLTNYTVEVVVLIVKGTASDAEQELDLYLQPTGAKSIRAAIKGDPTLGGVADKAFVVRFRDAGIIERGGVPHIGAFVDVEVWAS